MAQQSEPTLGALFAEASRDLSALVQGEINLAKSELRRDLKSGAMGGAMLAVAGALALVAFILLSFAAAYVIMALGLHRVWAFLIVGGVYLVLAGALAYVGKGLLERLGPPERTMRSSKETVAFLKRRRSSNAAATPTKR